MAGKLWMFSASSWLYDDVLTELQADRRRFASAGTRQSYHRVSSQANISKREMTHTQRLHACKAEHAPVPERLYLLV